MVVCYSILTYEITIHQQLPLYHYKLYTKLNKSSFYSISNTIDHEYTLRIIYILSSTNYLIVD